MYTSVCTLCSQVYSCVPCEPKCTLVCTPVCTPPPLCTQACQFHSTGVHYTTFYSHNSTFLGALQLWETNPIRVGESFLKHVRVSPATLHGNVHGLCVPQAAAFQDLYSAYCKNKPHSEAVMSESAECEAFFRVRIGSSTSSVARLLADKNWANTRPFGSQLLSRA